MADATPTPATTPTTPPATETPRVWRADAATPGAHRRRQLRRAIFGFAALVAVAIVLLFWLLPPRDPSLLPVVITESPDGPVAGFEQDRAALAEANLLGRPIADWAANPHRDQIRLRFRSLSRPQRLLGYRPAVAYLAAPAAVDAAGEVFLLPADRVGDHPRNRLTLAELLASFKESSARERLLILDLVPPTEDALLAAPAADLSAAVFRTLEANPDAGRVCLVSCGPGQTPLASPELGRTAFGFYLDRGLRGAADGWTGDTRDGRITVTEIAAYLRSKVTDWARATEAAAQTPVLLGPPADDFTVHAPGLVGLPEEPAIGSREFPDWLRAAWTRAEQPYGLVRASRKARAACLAAERALLAGRPQTDVQRELESRLTAADQLSASLTAAPLPNPLPILAAVYPGYVSPDPAIVNEMRVAVRQFDSRPVPAPATTAPGAAAPPPPPEPPTAPEFDPLKAKPHPLVALAAFTVLAEDSAPTYARVRAIQRVLGSQTPRPQFAETVLIRKLVDLGAMPGVVWSPERMAMALHTARWFEDAAARADVHVWAGPAVEQVYRLRADAEAVLFAPGYASTTEATTRLRAAETAARQLRDAAERLRIARAMCDEAVEWLAGATPAVYAGLVPFSVAEQLADATRELGDALVQPAEALDLEAFADRTAELDRHTALVRAAFTEFARPFRAEALVRLRDRAVSANAGPEVVNEIDAMLATPLLPLAERAELWNARGAIGRRLTADVIRKDTTTAEAIRRKLARPPEVNPRDIVAEEPTNAEATARRAAWTVALLRVGGVDEKAATDIGDELKQLAGDRFAFAERVRRVWTGDAVARLTPRLARLIPTNVVLPPAFDAPLTSPEARHVRDSVRKLWAWQAGRFEYESRERATEPVEYTFLLNAIRATRAAGGAATGSYLEVVGPTPQQEPKLTPDRRETELRVNLRSVGDDPLVSVRVAVLSPGEGWVAVGEAADVKLDPLRQGRAAVTLAAGDSPLSFPEAHGVLVEAEFGGRTYHRRVPVSIDRITSQLYLLVRTGPGQTDTAREIRLRPDGTPQPYQFMLSNPAPRERKVIARLVGLNREAEVTLPPEKAVALVFPAPPVVSSPFAPPPLQPGQMPPVDLGVLVPGSEVTLELRNPLDREEVLQTFRVPVVVANPADYLRVTDPVFLPAAGAKPSRLEITVTPGNVPPGGPCTVRLGFPPSRNPGLVVRDGNLVAPVERGGGALKLYAENLALPNAGANVVWVTVSADGVERAFTYTATLPTLGETVRLSPVGTPMIRVRADAVATGTAPLPVTLEVDNAPTGATLEFVVGTAKDDASPVEADLTQKVPTAKEVAARVKFDPKGETFLFSGVIRDHEPKVPVEQLVGKRVLEARMLDAEGKEIARDRVSVTFDGTAPRNVRFLDLPPKARNDQPLAVRATCDPTVSGIKEVRFFIGKPQGEAPPQNPPPVLGKLFDEKTNEWRASLPVAGQKGTITVGVQFVTNAGMGKIETQDVELADPAELNKPEPGNIAGKVVEGQLPQKGLVVFLYDAKGNAIDMRTTKDDGTFAFPDLAPGAYYLFTRKEATNREVQVDVPVKAGETAMPTLSIVLK